MGNHCETSPTYVIVGFQIRDEIDSRTHKNSIFDRVGISNAVCKSGSDKYSVDGIDCDYTRDTFYQAYHEIEKLPSLTPKKPYLAHT